MLLPVVDGTRGVLDSVWVGTRRERLQLRKHTCLAHGHLYKQKDNGVSEWFGKRAQAAIRGAQRGGALTCANEPSLDRL